MNADKTKTYFKRAPIGTSSRKLTSDGLPPSSDAATIMPWDSMPLSLRGARFATMATLRPTKASGLYASAMPATMLLGLGSPMSMWRCSSLSDFGTAAAARTMPTRRSTFRKSSIVMCETGCGAFPKTACWRAYFSNFQFFHFFDGDFWIGARENSGDGTQGLSGGQVAPMQIFRADSGDGRSESQLGINLCGGFGKDRREQRGNDAQGFGCGIESPIETLLAALHFGLLPGGLLDDVFVDGGDQAPDHFERFRKFEFFEGFEGGGGDHGGIFGDVGVAGRFRNDAAAILVDHRQRPAGEIAQAVGQVRVITAHERVITKTAVLAEDYLAQQEVAQGVGAEHFMNARGAHNVAARFAHFVVFEQQPAVGDDALGQRQVGGHQELGPIDGVEADDFLADEMQVGGPKILAMNFFAVDGGHVGGECVKPDVEHVLGFVGHGDAPLDGRAGDGEILQTLLDEGDDFVAARFGLNEIGLVFVELQEFSGVFGKLEIIIFFGDGFGGAAAIRAGTAGLGVVHIGVIEDAVLAGVVAFINLPPFAAAAEQILDAVGMAVAGGALEAIDVEAENLPLLAELFRDGVGIFLGSFSLGNGCAFDVDAVLIGAGGEDGMKALHPFERPDGIGGDGGVGVADVGGGVGVVDGGGEVIFVHLRVVTSILAGRGADYQSAAGCQPAPPIASECGTDQEDFK